MSNVLVSGDGAENFAVTADGRTLYMAGNDGTVRSYSVADGKLLKSWAVGTDLDGIAISPDGTTLLVVEQVAKSEHQTSDWPSNTAVVALYGIDVATGYRQVYDYTAKGSDYTFADVAFVDNTHVVVSENILPGWSGWAPLMALDLADGSFSAHGSYYAGLGYAASLTPARGGGRVLLGQLGLSSAEYFLIGASGNATANNGIYDHGVQGYAGGIEAFVGKGSSGRIAIVTGGGLHLYNGTFGYIANLAEAFPSLGSSPGIAFDSAGTVLYAIDGEAGQIVGISLDTLTVTQRIAVGETDFSVLQHGEELLLLPDDKTFLVNTGSGIVKVVRATDNIPTRGNDVLTGTSHDDTIAGGFGNDRISGWQGNDTLSGNDGSDMLAGGAGADVLNGGRGADHLYGNLGDDRLEGGKGTDILTGGPGADVFVFATGDSPASRLKADLVTDFQSGQDRIDLSAIDTNSHRGGLQPFVFIGTKAFAADASAIPGELRTTIEGNRTWIEGDWNHDGKADLSICLTGAFALTAADFVL